MWVMRFQSSLVYAVAHTLNILCLDFDLEREYYCEVN